MDNSDPFAAWLSEQLRDLKTDENVFGMYIIGILDGDETLEEKTEALEGLLGEIIDAKLKDFVSELMQKWDETRPKNDCEAKKSLSIDVNEQLAKLLEKQTVQSAATEREYTEEERRIKEQILAQYSQTEVSDDEIEEDIDEGEKTKPNAQSLTGIERNTNAQDVLQLQKERREQARMDSAAKKLKDKEDREKQKQLREEKKEKRKTVKNERRR